MLQTSNHKTISSLSFNSQSPLTKLRLAIVRRPKTILPIVETSNDSKMRFQQQKRISKLATILNLPTTPRCYPKTICVLMLLFKYFNTLYSVVALVVGTLILQAIEVVFLLILLLFLAISHSSTKTSIREMVSDRHIIKPNPHRDHHPSLGDHLGDA